MMVMMTNNNLMLKNKVKLKNRVLLCETEEKHDVVLGMVVVVEI